MANTENCKFLRETTVLVELPRGWVNGSFHRGGAVEKPMKICLRSGACQCGIKSEPHKAVFSAEEAENLQSSLNVGLWNFTRDFEQRLLEYVKKNKVEKDGIITIF